MHPVQRQVSAPFGLLRRVLGMTRQRQLPTPPGVVHGEVQGVDSITVVLAVVVLGLVVLAELSLPPCKIS